MDGAVEIKEHLYLTEDRTRVVPESDPAGRWLWASPGAEVDRAEALRLGAIKEEPQSAVGEDGFDPEKVAKAVDENPIELDAEQKPEPEAPAEELVPEEKQAKPAANKARPKAPNKSADKGEDK